MATTIRGTTIAIPAMTVEGMVKIDSSGSTLRKKVPVVWETW
jgi:hypothetical protein